MDGAAAAPIGSEHLSSRFEPLPFAAPDAGVVRLCRGDTRMADEVGDEHDRRVPLGVSPNEAVPEAMQVGADADLVERRRPGA
jgi:hypothetical protein